MLLSSSSLQFLINFREISEHALSLECKIFWIEKLTNTRLFRNLEGQSNVLLGFIGRKRIEIYFVGEVGVHQGTEEQTIFKTLHPILDLDSFVMGSPVLHP